MHQMRKNWNYFHLFAEISHQMHVTWTWLESTDVVTLKIHIDIVHFFWSGHQPLPTNQMETVLLRNHFSPQTNLLVQSPYFIITGLLNGSLYGSLNLAQSCCYRHLLSPFSSLWIISYFSQHLPTTHLTYLEEGDWSFHRILIITVNQFKETG